MQAMTSPCQADSSDSDNGSVGVGQHKDGVGSIFVS
jgi:hypothetical protein